MDSNDRLGGTQGESVMKNRETRKPEDRGEEGKERGGRLILCHD